MPVASYTVAIEPIGSATASSNRRSVTRPVLPAVAGRHGAVVGPAHPVEPLPRRSGAVSTVSACIACSVALRLAPDGIVSTGSRCRCTTCRSGKRAAQVVEVAEVRGRLEHPPLRRSRRAASSATGAAGASGAGGRTPARSRRCRATRGTPATSRAGLGHVREERVGEEDDLLLGLQRVHRVDREQVRRVLPWSAPRGPAPARSAGPRAAGSQSSARRDLLDLPAVARSAAASSAASSRCTSVVPLRIIPTTTTGAAITSSAISGWRRTHSCARSRIRRLCTTPGAQDERADLVEPGAAVAVEQHAERLLERARPEVVELLLRRAPRR